MEDNSNESPLPRARVVVLIYLKPLSSGRSPGLLSKNHNTTDNYY